MNQKIFTFAEFVTGGMFHSNNENCYIRDVYSLTEHEYFGKPECHISLFRYPPEYSDFYKRNKTISGYDGLIHCGEYLIADFDSAEDINKAKQDLITFCKHLETYLEDPEIMKIYFSGNKGFNLYIPSILLGDVKPSKNLHLRTKYFFESICNNIYEESGYLITTLDFQIYSKNHLIRLPNSLNTKGNMYKIPIFNFLIESLDIEEIRLLAKTPQVLEYPNIDIHENSELKKIFFQNISESNHETKIINGGNGLFLGKVQSGERNTTLLKNANRLRYKNISLNEAKMLLTLWNNSLSEPLSEKEFNNTVESAFKYETKEKTNNLDRNSFSNFEDRKRKYYEMIEDVNEKTIKTGYTMIDEKTRGIRPGEIALLTAVTGIGKSAITQNILMNYCRNNPNRTSLYFSLEMSVEEIFEREIQISEGIAGYEVENFNKNVMGLNNFITVTEPISVEMIPGYINLANEYFNEVGIVTIDHSGLLDGKGTDDYQKISNAMRFIKQVAMKYKIPIVMISQINRMTALNKEERINLFSAKSSGELENSSSFVLALEKLTNKNYGMFGYESGIIDESIIDSYDKNKINILCLTLLKGRRGGEEHNVCWKWTGKHYE